MTRNSPTRALPSIRRAARRLGLSLCVVAGLASPTRAQVCAEVKIEILQKLTFERVAFDARLVVTNNLATEPLRQFGVKLNISDKDGNDASDKFFVKVNSLQNISAVDGTGEIGPGVRAEVHWLLIPTAGAGGNADTGQTYFVGGAANFAVASGPQSLVLFPAPIIVRPQPMLQVDYFLPREVEADDPFTIPAEAPVPFSLGVRVRNDGAGMAGKLQITSGQPKIVENKQGLQIAFRLLGTSVNGRPVQPTLDATFGNIAPQKCGVAAWQMVTTLSGRFVSFDAQYTHAPDLGGEMTSLIKGTSANVLVREMLVDLPGSDTVRDFLADTDDDDEHLPDAIFDSACQNLAVSVVPGTTTGHPSSTQPDVSLTTGAAPGWSFVRVPDPSQGLVPLARVTRSDGKRLRPENFWISRVQDEQIKTLYHYFVNVVDHNTTGAYTLGFERPAADSQPPVTSIVFQEPFAGTNPTYLTPASLILFTATDDVTGVGSMLYRLDGGSELPAIPFSIRTSGPHTITFHSTDRAGNREADKTASVVVDPDPPSLSPITAVPATFVPSAPEGAAAPRYTTLTVSATDAIPDLAGRLEVASGSGPDFAGLPLVRSFLFTMRSGTPRPVIWNGRNDAGIAVPPGVYTLRVTVSEALGHSRSVSTTVQVVEFAEQTPVSGAPDADQERPDLRGSLLAWQDNREGNWDVFMISGTDAPVNLTAGLAADQTKPRTDGRYVVWQDRTNGNWDVVLHDTSNGQTRAFATEIADQENPVVAAPWVVWQESRNGQWDVVARHIDTGETVELSAGDPGAHDQIRPSISGTLVAIEDYRFGLADIFVYDLAARTERRITTNVDNQTQPTIDGATVVWVDERNENRDLYLFNLTAGVERRLTYTTTDESEPRLRAGRLAYTDYSAGLGDSAVALYDMASGRTLRLTSDPRRQEAPVVDGPRVVWQDDRTGRWQIMDAEVDLAALPLARDLGPGFNLVGLSDAEVVTHPRALSLLGAWTAAGGVVEVQRPAADGRMLSARIPTGGGAPIGDDFELRAGDAVVVHAATAGTLTLRAPATCGPLSVVPGANYVSLPCAPPGLTAKGLIAALGATRITSISRYDAFEGRFKALAVDGAALAGEDFEIVAGEGYLIHARENAGPFLP